MKYVGMYTQIRRNNIESIILLLMFPVIIFVMIWVFLALINLVAGGYYDDAGNWISQFDIHDVNQVFVSTVPWVVLCVGIWFAIAYFSNTAIIRKAVGAKPLERKDNPRVYNIVENLCMTCNMDMPQINIIDDNALNAFASGIDKKTYTVTLTTGIINALNDEELAGVVGHELTHIRNKDTRLLIISIIFVGIISTIMSLVVRMLYNKIIFSSGRNIKEKGAYILFVLVVGVICCAIAYLFTLLTRMAISRKREYMADAGGAELCGDPLALASALRKISGRPSRCNTDRDDIAQLFIVHPHVVAKGMMNLFTNMFSTHPDTDKRIKILEQF